MALKCMHRTNSPTGMLNPTPPDTLLLDSSEASTGRCDAGMVRWLCKGRGLNIDAFIGMQGTIMEDQRKRTWKLKWELRLW